MAIHEYYCAGCDYEFEVMPWNQEKDNTRHPCPECGKKVKRVMSKNSFRLKGGGWPDTYDNGLVDPEGGK